MTQVFQPPLIPAEGGSALPARPRMNFAVGASVTDDAVANETDVSVTGDTAALSIRIDTQSQSISVLSQAVSVISQFLSALSVRTSATGTSVKGLQSVLNAISNRISIEAPVGGGGGSVTSTEVSAVSAPAASALSQALSVLSVTDAGLSVRIDTQSQSISVLSQVVSVISQQVSALSQ